MTYRTKEQKIIDEVYTVQVAIKGPNVYCAKQDIEKIRENHILKGKFFVKTPVGKTIKFFILTEEQYFRWTNERADIRPPLFARLSKENIRDPDEYLYSSKDAVSEGSFKIKVGNNRGFYFILDNNFSAFTSKEVQLEVWEEWEENEFTEFMKRKVIKAKEELTKAEGNIVSKPEDVLSNLRTVIELSIKEKFEFEKISNMKNFLEDARKFNLPLPSYSLIHAIYVEGNKRLHAGQINTEFELEESIKMVKNFIDKLDEIEISKKQIEDFKEKSHLVN